MHSHQEIVAIMLAGALGGALSSLVAMTARRFTLHLMGITLAGAAAVYVVFAGVAGAGSIWMGVELAGVAVYAALAVVGVRYSPWWLVAGWLLHPLWDVVLHYFGPGHAFAPESYTIACVTWDWIAASMLAAHNVLAGQALPGAMASLSNARS